MPLGPQWYRKLRNEIRRGSRGAQPNFADVLTGTLYYVTDETVLERSSGAAWEPYSSTGEYRYVDSTATGTQNNWNLSVAYNTVVEWHGASDITVTGITGGLLGRFFIFRNTGTKIAYFSHNSGSSSAGNKLLNIVTAGDTPVAPGGYIGFVYFQTGSGNWNLIAHDQGPLIDIPYSSGNFTADAGTWTVDSGDIDLLAYKIEGRTKYVAWRLNTTSNSSAAATTFTISNIGSGYTTPYTVLQLTSQISDLGVEIAGVSQAGGTTVVISKLGFGTFGINTNQLAIRGSIRGALN